MAEIRHDAAAQQFSTVVEGHEAVLDYRLRDGVMAITHTGVPKAIEGRGIAAELTQRALDTARRAGWKVDPVCPYAAAYFAKHPEQADLLA